jgi:CarD family transcriptional regulator
MLKRGDAVIHPNHGAGILRATQTRKEVSGVKREYHRIELVSGRGTLFIPADHVQEAGLLPVPDDADLIISVLLEKPQELSDNYQDRKADITAKVHSGDIMLVAEVVRDLAWRERETKLSDGDAQLKAEAQDLLAGVLALQLNKSPAAAGQRLDDVISHAFESRMASNEPERGRWARIHSLIGIVLF